MPPSQPQRPGAWKGSGPPVLTPTCSPHETPAGRKSPADVRWAWNRLTGGAARVDELARELGWSRRHFTQRFKNELGLAPKTLARVARFQRARQQLSAGTPLGRIALDCGYYDQAHMNRDFRALAGRPPGELLPFVQDGDAVAA